jgi:alpha-amylase
MTEKSDLSGENYGNKTWRDFLGNREETITTAADGEGTFTCNGGASACG